MSLRIVQIDRTPKVCWQESPESLARLQPPTKAHTSQGPSKDPFGNQSSRFSHQSPYHSKQPFPISNLGPVSQQRHPTLYDPPTPPPDDESDAMDWTPTQASFLPVPVHAHTQKAQATTTTSPFYGRIPAAPQSQAQRLRNPRNQPTFRKATAEKQQNFFETMTRRLSPQKHAHNPETQGNESRASFEMAPPKFFPRGADLASEAGLVNLFSSAFSLRDEPPEIQAVQERRQQLSYDPESLQGRGSWARIISICSLGAASLLWKGAATMPLFALYFRLGALGVSATIAGCELLEAIEQTKAFWSLSDILLFVTELAISVFLCGVTCSAEPTHTTYDTLGMTLLGGMVVQEMWLFILALKHPPHHLTTEATSPPSPSPEASFPEPIPSAVTPPTRSRVREPPIPVSPMQLQSREPHMTRSRTKRESFIPSTSLSGLSLGTAQSDYGSPSDTSSIYTIHDEMRYQPESPVARRQLRTQRGLGAFGMNRY